MPESLPFDVLIIGAGPAGIAAASSAVISGARVAVIDENSVPGGQIYRASGAEPHIAIRDQFRELSVKGVLFIRNTTIVDAPEPGKLIGLATSGVRRFEYKKLILAVGARELFLPFPGWTLPNVMGVGGLQALVKGGLDVSGKRIVVAGSGPLLIAVGAYLKEHHAKVELIAEQAKPTALAQFLFSMGNYPSKIRQGVGLAGKVGSLVRPGRWVERANGNTKVESIKLNKSNGIIPCDYLACAFGFVPNLELPMLLGCEIENGFVKVGNLQETSVPNVFCAGEPTGIGGIDLSTVEGQIAGFSATGQNAPLQPLKEERETWSAFARDLDRTFAIRPELKKLATSETIVCRCEDVRLGQLSGWESGRSAKLHTRCGMGPCQGRICGPATRFLFGWEHGTVRPPLVPLPLSGLENKDQAATKQPI